MVVPSYKEHLEIPGGMVELGETPYEGAKREVLEEIGLQRPIGRLLIVEWYREDPNDREAKLRFIFDGGVLGPEEISTLCVDGNEIVGYRFCFLDQLNSESIYRLANRVRYAVMAREHGNTIYLEDGKPVSGVTDSTKEPQIEDPKLVSGMADSMKEPRLDSMETPSILTDES